MGCQFYNQKKNNVIDVLFMHDDSWDSMEMKQIINLY